MNALVAAAWVICQVPCTFSSITVRKPLGVIASAGLMNWPPALLTSRSTRPWRSSTPSTKASTASSSRMSRGWCSNAPPSAATDSAVSARGSGRRPQPITVAPSRASSFAVARPIPVPAPETMQTWPWSRPGAKILELGDVSISGEHMGCGRPDAGHVTTLAGVKVRADAIPLEGPLPGGSDGVTVVVEPMEAGRAHWAPEFFEYPGGGPLARLRARGKVSESTVPCPAFLVRHPGVGPVLIDTGLHPSVATDPRHNLGRTLGRFFELEHGGDVVSQLRGKSIAGGDVAVVILTHLHADHASAISE